MSKTGYIFNKSDDNRTANILINEPIGNWWGEYGLQSMHYDISSSNAESVMVQINSVGGSVTEGQAIAAYIQGSPININTSILGLCASSATFIAMSGKETSIAKGSLFMIHRAEGGTFGRSEELRKTADLVDLSDDMLADRYVDTIKQNGKLINNSTEDTKAQVVEWMEEETFFTAEQAVEHGFIQKVTDGVEFLNKNTALNILNSIKGFKSVPSNYIDKLKNISDMSDEKSTDEKKSVLENMGQALKNFFSSSEGKEVIKEATKEELNPVDEAK